MKTSSPTPQTLPTPPTDTSVIWRRGEQYIWLAGCALSISLILIVGLLGIVFWNGAGFYWPHRVAQIELKDGGTLAGIVTNTHTLRESVMLNEKDFEVKLVPETQFKVGNRDMFGADFIWKRDEAMGPKTYPKDIVVLERTENGDFIGYLKEVRKGDQVVAAGPEAWNFLTNKLKETSVIRAKILKLEKYDIGDLNFKIRKAQLDIRKARLKHGEQSAEFQKINKARLTEIADFKVKFAKLQEEIDTLRASLRQWSALFATAGGEEKVLDFGSIIDAYQPNNMGFSEKVRYYVIKVYRYIVEDPRESNQEGGVFPAIFGTVMMTLIMSLAVTPFGVLAAFYLREYAKQGPFVRAVRIAINNLAGVPSIVFGIFGLGFFVYFVGGNIDRLFFPEALPTPTYGTGGILWASLTLALLTVPVVIVATEESIAAVPRGVREGSLALGASKFQTICGVILPAAVPGILTGIILAMARGAGEVAPLMITGVVKLAPELPFDTYFPFFHLDRKFMHLGFHIYDVGFQSPNVEASKPMVYTTTLLLIAIVVALNIVAIRLRDRIRKKFESSVF